ncbi:RNA methyltransferase [Prosthecochloris sp. N3]|uniref:RNA methyltransferase n=1 Tax=Prosthecochloris ethylica TaxID=2743976 RepID=A0ABR9XQ88_9CHLB|nr:RNA methyltransferase [Prosthecochloris ethylica]MBF0585415.1 RNA methyltransferase [Prosthecochloris ethylica]MBF0636201.1 RNA methyltransferase [Prosthecochloris ethylica]NUK46645.1 RNA methyltransferase [Prosthecochloris ethylica]
MKYRKLDNHEMGRCSAEEYRGTLKHPVTVLLHNIRSMYNVGSVFRTADAAGIEKVLISGYTATPPRKEIDKTALGAQDSMAWEYCPSPLDTLRDMKHRGVTICGLEITENSRPYTEVQVSDFPMCLILGNEVQGIDDELLAECDHVLEIPQFGTKHSLNVAVAAGVALFEMIKIFRQESSPGRAEECFITEHMS